MAGAIKHTIRQLLEGKGLSRLSMCKNCASVYNVGEAIRPDQLGKPYGPETYCPHCRKELGSPHPAFNDLEATKAFLEKEGPILVVRESRRSA